MSGVGWNTGFKKPGGLPEDQEVTPPARRSKTHGYLINELETEYSLLSAEKTDYNLLSRIEQLYKEVITLSQESEQAANFFLSPISDQRLIERDRINTLFDKALNHHGLHKRDGRVVDFEQKLKIFAKNGDLEGLKFLLSEGRTLSNFNLMIVLGFAAEKGHLECLRFLLNEKKTLQEQTLALVAGSAALHGHLECLQFLLSEGRTLSEDNLVQIAIQAEERGSLESLRFILSQQIVIPRLYRERMVLRSASRGLPDFIELLLRQGPIGRSIRDSAMTQASGENRDVIRDILRYAPVTEELLGVALLEGLEIDSIEHVASNPLFYLNKVMEDGFPKRILLAGKSTIDFGGVSKEFIFTLFSSLASHLDLDRLSFPIPQDESKKELFQKLGALLSMLSAKNKERTDKFLIGSLFNKEFYQILKLALEKGKGDELNLLVAQILSGLDESYKLTAQVILDPENQVYKQEFADVYGSELQEVNQNVKEIIESYSNAALWILEGADEPFKTLIGSSSSEDLCLMFQGKEATADEIKGAIKIEDQLSELLEQQKAWLFQILDESDLPWRKKFLTYITGRDVLLPGGKPILLKTTWREYPEELKRFAFEAHTCFNSIDLPNYRFTSKEDFLAGLNDEMAKKGYTIA